MFARREADPLRPKRDYSPPGRSLSPCVRNSNTIPTAPTKRKAGSCMFQPSERHIWNHSPPMTMNPMKYSDSAMTSPNIATPFASLKARPFSFRARARPSRAGETQRAGAQFRRDDQGVGHMVRCFIVNRAPEKGRSGRDRVHRQNMPHRREIGLVIEDIVEADQQRQQAHAADKKNFRAAKNHGLWLPSWFFGDYRKSSYIGAPMSSARNTRVARPAKAPICLRQRIRSGHDHTLLLADAQWP